MHVEYAFAAVTLLAAVGVGWQIRRARLWPLLCALVLVGGFAGMMATFGLHEVCCMNYRYDGEFKRGNDWSDWRQFLAPLAVEVAAFGTAFRLRRR